ncbi:lactate racemase domain-containing protein [Rubrobacter indicoceani]|uniref:lactate racemase domain-containing protein n=1 Tax=Rubrobacter indicoceani TaxID=2051957 RepID=UPI000E5C4256|nr:lactate racemase domain-containing protein [Rubrobacter indicoceani]
MQEGRLDWDGIRDVLEAVAIPEVSLVEQRFATPPGLGDIERAVREALEDVELPTGSVAIGVGSRGVARIGEIVAALVAALKEAGASPFVVPAMGSHGASTAEGQAEVLAYLGVSEAAVGCPVRATMETVEVGRTPAGIPVHLDRNAYEADAVVVVNRVKPHTAFRGPVESGPTKMLAIGLGKRRGAHHIHRAGWENIHRTIPDAARILVGTGKVAFGLATVENADEEPCRIAAIPPDRFREAEAGLLEEAKRNLPVLPFDEIDVLVVDEIGKNISGDGADPNVTGRYPTPYAHGGPQVNRMVFLGLTQQTEGNANGVGLADVVTERLADAINRPATYMNSLTSTVPTTVKLPMTTPTGRDAVAAALVMCAGVEPQTARVVRIRNTLAVRRMWVSEAARSEANVELAVIEGPEPMDLD